MNQQGKIAVIGCGNMGHSLIGGLIANGYPADLIYGIDPAGEQRQAAARLGIHVSAETDATLSECMVVILAVKPQMMSTTLAQLQDLFTATMPLFISVAAGIKTAAIAAGLYPEAAIVRVMPNTPSLLQQGAAALFANAHVSEQQKQRANFIMESVGLAVWLEQEELLDAVTAVSGTGPAYFFFYIELLEKIARELGLDAANARALTTQTALGAATMVSQAGQTPAALRAQVTSPGGTTERALQVLMDGRLEQLLREAVTAALNRSIELSQQAGNS